MCVCVCLKREKYLRNIIGQKAVCICNCMKRRKPDDNDNNKIIIIMIHIWDNGCLMAR